ncbi:hypothetical protein ACN93_15125 [Gordonia paraffinivorans]|uniref:hypothetical protein n=1 Tax=Gordonia paraffinivorans TaxID=175628 RepID=UPI000D61051D|nr:hypothetical protein [Gordonia paraffinivorans]PWD42223.1 hypothetical protein ACN93_15125 [Gordonia paraffinivorans]
MSTTDDDKITEQTTETGPEASETTDAAATENAETGSESAESEDGSPQGDPDNAGEGNSEPDNFGAEASETPPEGDTFPRAYVEDLRKESAGYRTQVRELQERLHRMSVEQTGSLADPADLPFDPAHLDSPEALQAAIAELLAAKPHLKARKFVGDVGQGSRGSANAGVDLLGILRSRA